MLNIEKNREGNTLTVVPEGRVDTTTASQFEQELKASIDGVTELILDFGKLNYISSAGLRVLLTMQKTMSKQGSMKLCNVNETVTEILEVTGFTEILTIE